MSRFLSVCLLAGCGIVSILAASHPPQSTSMAGDRANASKATIEGLVRDVACPIQNLDSSATHLSLKCVTECVRGGSPLVILTNDGVLYFPISAKMPDTDQRPAFDGGRLDARPIDCHCYLERGPIRLNLRQPSQL